MMMMMKFIFINNNNNTYNGNDDNGTYTDGNDGQKNAEIQCIKKSWLLKVVDGTRSTTRVVETWPRAKVIGDLD